MHRRSFIQAGSAASLLGAIPRFARAQQLPFAPKPAGWRTFEITSRIEILKPEGVSRAWVPVPSVESDYQKVIGNTWSGNGSTRRDGDVGVERIRKSTGSRGGQYVFDHQPRHRLRQAQSGDQDRPRHGEVRY